MKTMVSEVELIYKTKVKPSNRATVTQSKDAYNIFKSVYDFNKIEHKEMMYAMYLNNAKKVLAVLLISEGGITGTVSDIRVIFQGALKTNATAIILSHNHPTGNMKASATDIALTKQVKDAGKILNIELCDHLIISPEDGQYLSMADEGII